MIKEEFSKKTILYLVHDYNSFQKDPIEEMAQYFKKIYVLVRYKPISKIAKFLPVKWLKKYDDSYVINMHNVPQNVEVIRTPVWYLPFGIFYKWSGDLHYFSVERAIKKYNIKFDIVHSHFLWSAGYVGMKIKEKYKVPFVVTGHGFDVYQLPFESKSWEEKIKCILENSDGILTVSRKNKESLKMLGIRESRINILENGYNSKLFFRQDKRIVRKELGINNKAKVLVTVGSLEKVKGHIFLIKAINLLRDKYPHIKSYIIGAGSLEDEMHELIRSLNLEENVYLIGQIPHKELNKWINACDVFVMSSLNEGCPISMLEALGCGKPFVGTSVGGIPEVIKSEEYGELVKSEDEKELSFALERALERQWDENKIAKYGNSFSIDKLTVKALNFYKII